MSKDSLTSAGSAAGARFDDRPDPQVPARSPLRIGQGYDVHALVPGRALIVGGVEVAHTHGLLGHSDADVLLHAITDAILGAAGLGDIGRHFPDDDSRFAGADSLRLLCEARARVAAAGYRVVNLDSTIIAQAPKMAPYIGRMVEAIAAALEIAVDRVNVKAKTAERLGFAGRGEGIAAEAIALIEAYRAPEARRTVGG
jgi:2-C-methyl-D-erythritol 2,4-cyclodiphosphate synthase